MRLPIDEDRYSILRWDDENTEFGWYLIGSDDYIDALNQAESHANESRLFTDLIGVRDNETREIVALALKMTPEDLPLSLVQIYEMKEWK